LRESYSLIEPQITGNFLLYWYHVMLHQSVQYNSIILSITWINFDFYCILVVLTCIAHAKALFMFTNIFVKKYIYHISNNYNNNINNNNNDNIVYYGINTNYILNNEIVKISESIYMYMQCWGVSRNVTCITRYCNIVIFFSNVMRILLSLFLGKAKITTLII